MSNGQERPRGILALCPVPCALTFHLKPSTLDPKPSTRQLQQWFLKLSVNKEGVLYEDSSIQIGLKTQYQVCYSPLAHTHPLLAVRACKHSAGMRIFNSLVLMRCLLLVAGQ